MAARKAAPPPRLKFMKGKSSVAMLQLVRPLRALSSPTRGGDSFWIVLGQCFRRRQHVLP